jgi:hypothetical protein
VGALVEYPLPGVDTLAQIDCNAAIGGRAIIF